MARCLSARNSAFLVCLLLVLLFLPVLSMASEGIKFVPRVSVGVEDYELEIEPTDILGGLNWKLGDMVPFAKVGGTFFYNRFFADINYQRSADGDFDISGGVAYDTGFIPDLPTLAPVATFVGSAEFYNYSYAVSAGYQLLDNLSVYAGYKQIFTKFDLNVLATFDAVDDGSITGTPGFPLQLNQYGDFDVDYDAKGPFLGTTYGFLIGEEGVLSLNLAVAYLDGDIKQKGNYVNVATGAKDDSFDLSTSGDSIGFSYGVSYSSNLSEKLSYALTANGYTYDFDSDGKTLSDFNEQSYQFSCSLSYHY